MQKTRAPKKISIGAALCRRDPATRMPQLLLVRSRTSYNFNSFVFGKYRPWDTAKIQALLNGMTSHEKVLLMSLDFSKFWYHIWLNVPTHDTVATSNRGDSFYQFYINCRNKYEKLVARDGGRRFCQLVESARSIDLGWTIPRGRLEPGESEIACAVREVEEETTITPRDYTLFEDVKPLVSSYEEDNAVYVCKYYVAAVNDSAASFEPSINYANRTQVSEISAIGWFGLREIRGMTGQNDDLYRQARIALRLFKSRSRPAQPQIVADTTHATVNDTTKDDTTKDDDAAKEKFDLDTDVQRT